MKIIKLENNNGELTTTSLEIARVTNRKHKNTMQEIREELSWSAEKIDPRNLGDYKDKQGKSRPYYTLDEYETLQVMSKYSREVRSMVIAEFKRMKEHIQSQQKPQTTQQFLIQAMQHIEDLQTQVVEMKPKVEFYDQVTESTTAVDMATCAKVLNRNIGRNELFERLRNEKVLQKNNQPYQKYIDNGWFRVIEQKYQKPTGELHINFKTVVYQKGIAGINKILDKKSTKVN